MLLLAAAALIFSSCSTPGRQEAKKPPDDPPGEVIIPVSEQAGMIHSEVAQVRDVADVIRVPGLVALADDGRWRVGAVTSGRIERVRSSFRPRHPLCQALPIDVLLALKRLRFNRSEKITNLSGREPIEREFAKLLATFLLLLG